MRRGTRLARWLLERCAPRDASVAIGDLEEATADGSRAAGVRFWYEVALICAWGIRGRLASAVGGSAGPVHAVAMAFRSLGRAPGIVVTVSVMLGLGLTAAVVLLGFFFGSLRPLPVPRGEDIVQVRLLDDRAEAVRPGRDVLARWRAAETPVMGVGATLSEGVTVTREGGGALRTAAARVSPGVLELLGIPPVRGRLLSPGAEDAGAVLLRQDVWQELEVGAISPLGATVRIDGVPHQVVGIMPADFGFPENQRVWRTLAEDEVAAADQIVGRLRPGADPERAADALASLLGPGLDPAVEGDRPPSRVRIVPYVGDRGEGGENVAFAALGVLVALLLVLCTANASILLLVRATDRVRSLAIHSALGAPRVQIVLQLLLETGLVVGAGGLLGLLGGGAVLRWADTALAPHFGYYWMQMEVGPGVLVATAFLVGGCALVAGTLPALQAIRVDIRDVLSAGGRGRPRGRDRIRWFVGAQIALSTTGLVIALILARGFALQGSLLVGVPADRIAMGSLTLEEDDPEALRRTVDALRERLAAVPGALATTVSVGIPGFGTAPSALRVEDGAPADPGEARRSTFWMAGDTGFLDTFGLRLLQGRGIEPSDARDAPLVALVTRSFVDRRLPAGDPVGRRIRLETVHPEGRWAEIVGVVEDYHPADRIAGGDGVILSLDQVDADRLYLSARSDDAAADLVPGLREAVRQADPDLALERAESLAAFMAWLVRMPRVMSAFGAIGGFVGVLVASVGLFGVLSFRVRQRLSAVGVRMALGASGGRILGEVLREAVLDALPWIAGGLALALLISPATVIFSFGVPFREPLVYLAGALSMVAVILVTALLPALRAARLDPLVVLQRD